MRDEGMGFGCIWMCTLYRQVTHNWYWIGSDILYSDKSINVQKWICTNQEFDHGQDLFIFFPLFLDKFKMFYLFLSSCLLISLYNPHIHILLNFRTTLSMQFLPFLKSIFFPALWRKIMYINCNWFMWLSIFLFKKLWKPVNIRFKKKCLPFLT